MNPFKFSIFVLSFVHAILAFGTPATFQFLGDLEVLDDPDTPQKEGRIYLEGQVQVGGNKSATVNLSSIFLNSDPSLANFSRSIVSGQAARGSWSDNIILGGKNVTGFSNVVLGSDVSGSNNISIDSSVAGSKNLSIKANTTGDNNINIGGTISSVDYSLVVGPFVYYPFQTDVSAYIFAMGKNLTIPHDSSASHVMMFGNDSEAKYDHSVVIGNGLKNYWYASFVIGQYNAYADDMLAQNAEDGSWDKFNVWNESEPLFVVGNGHSNTNRSNAMVVYKNGKPYSRRGW